jgi:hypothetical protein
MIIIMSNLLVIIVFGESSEALMCQRGATASCPPIMSGTRHRGLLGRTGGGRRSPQLVPLGADRRYASRHGSRTLLRGRKDEVLIPDKIPQEGPARRQSFGEILPELGREAHRGSHEAREHDHEGRVETYTDQTHQHKMAHFTACVQVCGCLERPLLIQQIAIGQGQ